MGGSQRLATSPIQCWCPAQFPDFQVEYINNYCWVRNTYVVDFNESLSTVSSIKKTRTIRYYQWIPLILVFQALFFYAPRMFWLAFSGYSSLNIKKLLRMTDDITLSHGNTKQELIQGTVQDLQKYLKIRNCLNIQYKTWEEPRELLAAYGFHKGNFLVLIFLMTSLLYVISTVGQIVMVDILLGVDFKTLGFDVLSRVYNDKAISDYRRFPTVTFCDFDIRHMTNIQTWTVQCSLPINLFSEMIFITDWFILVFMTIINAIYFLYHLVSTVLPYRAEIYIRKFMEVDGERASKYQKIPEHELEKQRDFIHCYLRRDGVFLIWLMSNKVNHVVAGEIVNNLWKNYRSE
ncbi:innexin unc-9-like [Mytilus californianus]|uniref:innexin unc-9-like n=1 Tax=Mytilus californianus TaxID=6549 RepID=UPI0022452CE8|nr:innexin unc-9-like [Mytilus californianus]